MTPNNLKHAVFETSRHGDGSAKVQIVGAFGTFGIVVPAGGRSERMTHAQKIEALRNALKGMGEASVLLGRHLDHIDPDGRAAEPPEDATPRRARIA